MRVGTSGEFDRAKYQIMVLYLFLAPFFDGLTGWGLERGWLTSGGLLSPSQIWRICGLLLMAYILLRDRSAWGPIVALGSFLLFVEWFASLFYHHDVQALGIGLSYAFKVVYLLILFRLFHYWIRSGITSKATLLRLSIWIIFIYALVVVIGFVTGTGLPSYAYGQFGTKGFFASNNALSILLGVGSLLPMARLLGRLTTARLLVSLLVLAGCILVASKTSLVFSALYGIVLFFRLKAVARVFFILALLGVVAFSSSYLQAAINSNFEIVFYRFSSVDGVGKFFEFLWSSRNLFLDEAFRHLEFDGVLVTRLLWGCGVVVSFRNPFFPHMYQYKNDYFNSLETDAGDVFFSYGLIGLATFISILVWMIYRSFRGHDGVVLTTVVSTVAFSTVAGHVLFDGMGGYLLPLLAAIVMKDKINTSGRVAS